MISELTKSSISSDLSVYSKSKFIDNLINDKNPNLFHENLLILFYFLSPSHLHLNKH